MVEAQHLGMIALSADGIANVAVDMDDESSGTV